MRIRVCGYILPEIEAIEVLNLGFPDNFGLHLELNGGTRILNEDRTWVVLNVGGRLRIVLLTKPF